MKSIWVICQNTYREVIRDRILYGLVVFALILIGLSLALGQLSFTEQGKIAMDFGLVGIQLSAVILSVFAGSTLVSREIEKQTILTLLSRPISRQEFLLGKFFGLLLVVFVIMTGLSLILVGLAYVMKIQLGLPFAIGLLGVLLESLVMLSATLMLGVVMRPFLTVACSIALFLIGHWLDNLEFFATRSEDESFRIFGVIVSRILPNLEKFNWRSMVVYQEVIEFDTVAMAALYALGWMLIFISISTLIFRRKDFV